MHRINKRAVAGSNLHPNEQACSRWFQSNRNYQLFYLLMIQVIVELASVKLMVQVCVELASVMSLAQICSK